ncbi:hypothetical protein A3A70_03030 [candidate division WWE3 bacterium RIFCSPLOWO2_01_FULL_42_11]|uniref:Uncharacterized protein n=2 Tax=Bacteria candidate phyla TaxID=1783234 RepID=A0A1F4VS88_UNCKA|nr:MAG: hypothetical protein A3A70_03030 [candidate division WWE3 bacterium RIFCSPLOWO2_01_FULL_42_11]OGG15300.1 MAG: hypothetical protein A2773_03125 [Candidatus Gottesmanbacteria bacterium RIFCSPHIGHO2_01_FULL_39_10]
MSLTTRIEKLEARIEEIAPKEDQINYVIQYKRDESGAEHYHIRRDGDWCWVIKEELDKFLAKFQDNRGMLIFVPEWNKE